MKRERIDYEIMAELYKACQSLGAKHDLLCTIGSYGDTQTDEQILEALKEYNKYTKDENEAI